jgi:hypothetical protein
MKTNIINTILLMFITLSFLSSCGGSGGSSSLSSSSSGTTTVSNGTMTKGSVIVNGVTFTLAADAPITIDDNPNRAESELANGMQVHIRGRVNTDDVTGVADKIEAEDEVQGTVSAKNIAVDPDTLTIAGQTILVDSSVIFANDGGQGIAAITAGVTEVEVHGQRDNLGNIIATRIEIKNELADNDVEVKGIIANTTATTFTINGQLVNFAAATRIPATATFANGNRVEVEGTLLSGVITAFRVELEDVEDADFIPAENERFEVEGFVASFTAHPGTFKVGNTTVVTSSSTQFRDGSSSDLANGVAVEAEGVLSGGVFNAREIKFKKKVIRIITDNWSGLTSTQLTMMGKTVLINSLTTNTDVTNSTTRVQMRGYIDTLGNIVAQQINDAGNSQGNKDILQAGVTAKNTGLSQLTMLGIIADLSGGSVEFKNDDDVSITRTAFFTAVTPLSAGGTIVKVRGDFNTTTPTISAEEAEIED